MNRANILIVDDKKTNIITLSALLSENFSSINIIDVDNGEDALKVANQNYLDLIILDVQMPDMDGFEVASLLKHNPKTKEIPIIFLTALHKSEGFEKKGYNLGAIEYFTKPIQENQFINRIRLYLELFEKNREIERQRALLQGILDSEKNLTITTDFENVTFANKSFLKFFGVKNVKECKKKFKNILNIFLEHRFYLNTNFINTDNKTEKEIGESFYKLINSTEETSRIVIMADKDGEHHSFYIGIDHLIDLNDNNNYLISLTDITEMTIEKRDILKKAYIDNLTGIKNRYKFEEVFEYQLEVSKRYKQPLSLAVIDIDNFKNFNDKYGHLIGDDMLIMLAHKINNNVRKTDTFARWGGEEFVILFNETDLANAVKISETLKDRIETLEHDIAGGITASFGVAQHQNDESLGSLFERADKALYEAKASGRNAIKSL